MVSYGGSSLLSTLIIFAIIQGLYLLREREENEPVKKKPKKKKKKGGRVSHEETVKIHGTKVQNFD